MPHGRRIAPYPKCERRRSATNFSGIATATWELVVVDGASFFNMMRAHGIWQVEYPALYNILVDRIGAIRRCVMPPQYILPPKGADYKGRLESCGFCVSIVATLHSQDDEAINAIMEAADSSALGELVLVSADFFGFAGALRAKAHAGVRVFIAATKKRDPDSKRPMLGHVSRQMMAIEGYEFVNLGDYEAELMRAPWGGGKRRVNPGRNRIRAGAP